MLPPFDSFGNLPPGIHHAGWQEIVDRFGATAKRRQLLQGLKLALESLRVAGCAIVFLNGSFVTAKAEPGDFDACWEIEGVDVDRLDSVLLQFDNRRVAQKAKYGGELFPSLAKADPFGTRFLEFFQRDRLTGNAKGILAIDLREFS